MPEETNEALPAFPRWLKPWLWGGLGIFIAWGVFVASTWAVFRVKHEYFGQWGDSFAPLTGIASTLALVFLAWSVDMQRGQLRIQRKELQAQRKQLKAQLEELKLAREEMAAQREEMKAQRLAQEASAAAQVVANRIANLANAVALAQSRVAAYQFAVEAMPGRANAVSLVNQALRDPSFGGSLEGLTLTASSIRTIDALHRLLETTESLRVSQSDPARETD